MKLDPKFKMFIIVVILISFLGVGYMLYFDDSFIPNFPYKYSKINEKTSEVSKLTSEAKSLTDKLNELNEKIKSYNNSEQNNNIPDTQYEDMSLDIPYGMDYASIL